MNSSSGAAGSGRTEGNGSDDRGHTEKSFTGRVRDRAGERLTAQKDRASDGMQSMVQAVRDVTHRLRDEKHETLAEYGDRAAEQLERISVGLRNKAVGELLRDAQNIARQRPAMFVGSAFVIGLVGARFFKSSTPSHHQSRSWRRGPQSTYGEAGQQSQPGKPQLDSHGTQVTRWPAPPSYEQGSVTGRENSGRESL